MAGRNYCHTGLGTRLQGDVWTNLFMDEAAFGRYRLIELLGRGGMGEGDIASTGVSVPRGDVQDQRRGQRNQYPDHDGLVDPRTRGRGTGEDVAQRHDGEQHRCIPGGKRRQELSPAGKHLNRHK